MLAGMYFFFQFSGEEREKKIGSSKFFMRFIVLSESVAYTLMSAFN